MKLIVVNQLSLSPGTPESELSALASRKFKTKLQFDRILKKSVDARDKSRVIVSYRVVFQANDGDVARLIKFGAELWEEPAATILKKANTKPKILIIGSGPAGLFAALRLLAQGIPSTVIERGKAVEERQLDIDALRRDGILNSESNVLFGEGGAGTWSDGKLTTRIHKDGIDWIFDQFVAFGAPKSIQWEAKPHIGTDILSKVVINIRKHLVANGCSFQFGEKIVDLVSRDGALVALRSASGQEYPCDHCIAATGHSAREFYALLAEKGIALEAKGFAVGMRIEHPADFINHSQYGEFATRLPPADYRLVYNNPESGRGIYSFCMCPGGEVVNASSEPGMLCVNGMSWSKRDLEFSNAAIVVNLRPQDLGSDPLAGIALQRELEMAAFNLGGQGFASPAMSARAFVEGTDSLAVRRCSYLPKVQSAPLNEIFPEYISQELRTGLLDFDRRIKGFIDQGTLIGCETRTSSPVRICRDETLQSITLRRFYPVGEGAGYSGGIVSSAVDGLRAADQIAGNYHD